MTAPLSKAAQEIRSNGVVIVQNSSELPELGISHDSKGVTKRVLLSYHDTKGFLTQVSEATYRPGSYFAPHVHTDMDESFGVKSGTLILTFGDEDEELVLEAGGFVYFPAGIRHGGRSVGGAVVQTIGVRQRRDLGDDDSGKGKNIPAA